MPSRFSLAIICLTLCHVASAEESLPNSPPPSLGIARISKQGLDLHERVVRFVTQTRIRRVPVTRLVDGKRITEYREEKFSVRTPVMEQIGWKLSSGRYLLYDIAGKIVPDKDHAKLLSEDRVVLISTDGKPVAEFYRKLYRPGILIVVAPRPAFPVPPAKFDPAPSRGAKTKTETPKFKPAPKRG